MEPFTCKPIGVIHSPYRQPHQAPRQGRGEDAQCEIEVFTEYEAGLADIDDFSHLLVIYWLNRSESYTLSVQTPWDTVPHGVFATRSPRRPNPIGICPVKVLSRNGRRLNVKWLDALDETPLLDIKPYIPEVDAVIDAHTGWLTGKFQPRSSC
jgi:formylmethanofuran dehydrogenase subunit E